MKNLLMFFKKTNAEPLAAPEPQASGVSGKAATAKSATSEKAAQTPNPYVEARREWNERYGDYISQARNWRFVSILCCIIAIASVIGVSYIGAQNKIVPYVVQVDKFGAAVAVGPADKAAGVTDQKIIKSFVARFVADWRTVTVDRVAQKEAVVRLYSMLPLASTSQTKMNEYYQESNPFTRMQQGTIAVELSSVLPISDKTWQVEWTEVNRNLRGEPTGKVRFKASLVVALTPPTEERQIIMNPLGVYITDFNVAQQL
jgi:type IV secretion system protein VirB5